MQGIWGNMRVSLCLLPPSILINITAQSHPWPKENAPTFLSYVSPRKGRKGASNRPDTVLGGLVTAPLLFGKVQATSQTSEQIACEWDSPIDKGLSVTP